MSNELQENLLRGFHANYRQMPEVLVSAPGRINLIGEHTDYNDGYCLPMSIRQEILTGIAGNNSRTVDITALDLNRSCTIDLDSLPEKLPQWAAYSAGVVIELQRAGYLLTGANLLFCGDVPKGAGLSSSAAVEVSVANAWRRWLELDVSDLELIRICQRAEHNHAGVKCGILDQYSSLLCKPDTAMLLDCRLLDHELVELPKGFQVLSAYSGISRRLSASAYNERRNSCHWVASFMASIQNHGEALRDFSLDELEAVKEKMSETEYRRGHHVITENNRVRQAARALRESNIPSFADILNEGHTSLSRDYEVSLPLIDKMAQWLRQQPGVLAARLTGAGFGGSLVVVGSAMNARQIETDFTSTFSTKTKWPQKIHKVYG